MTLTSRLLIAAVFLLPAVIVLWNVWHRRRDRQWGRTAWITATGVLLLFLGAGLQGWTYVALPLLWFLALGGPAAGLFLEVRNRHERRAARDSAIAGGVEPSQARRLYRRPPSSSPAVLGWWILSELIVILTLGGLLTVLHAPLTVLEQPVWSSAAVLPGFAAPWWIWAVMLADLCAFAHVAINAWRASDRRQSPQTQ